MIGVWAVTFRPQSLGGPVAYTTVDGHSMTPTMNHGDLVLVRHASDYKVGDVILFDVPRLDGSMAVVHRIIGGNAEDGYVTKGDHNPEPDPVHPKSLDIKGKVWLHLPWLGGLLTGAANAVSLVLFALAFLVLMVFWESAAEADEAAAEPAGVTL